MAHKQPLAINRRDALKSIGLLGTGTAAGSSMALNSGINRNLDQVNYQLTTEQTLSPAERPVWVTHEYNTVKHTKELNDPDEYIDRYLRHELSLQYFGAVWEPNPDYRDEPVWRHKFMLAGVGFNFQHNQFDM